MQNQVVGNPTAFFDALRYGPLGLAGLMLVLVIVALSVSRLEAARERLLRLFLYIGSFCFVVACIFAALPTYLGASHLIYFRVEPLDMGAKNSLPPPVITINGGVLTYPASYAVKSDVTAIVDVNDAVNAAEDRAAVAARQKVLLDSTLGLTQQAGEALNKSNDVIIKYVGECNASIPTEFYASIVDKNKLVLSALNQLQQAIRSPTNTP